MPVALVTGASRGFGRVLAITLSGEGYRVVLNYRSSDEEALGLLEEIGSAHGLLVKADVGDMKQVERMTAEIKEKFGRLDAIINNAGVTMDNLLLRQSEKEWDETIRTNLRACFNILQVLAPVVGHCGGGHIINMSSYSGVKGKAGQAAYSASKAAVLGLTRTAAIELAERNIRVNAVLPGYMATGMGTGAESAMGRARRDSVLEKLSDPAEVAAFILYLLKTQNITGQVFSLESRIL
jgi:3-oxoacyl-[acyl-carrier protein] reductase